MGDIKASAKVKKGTISARVFRAATGKWEDLGVIAKTAEKGLLGRLKEMLAGKKQGRLAGPGLPDPPLPASAPVRQAAPAPCKLFRGVPNPSQYPVGVLRVLQVTITEDRVLFRCIMEDGSIEFIDADQFKEK